MFGSHGKMYFFDLKTGRRHPDVISIPSTPGGYNPYTNEFWFYDENSENLTLKSFTVVGLDKNTSGVEKDSLGSGSTYKYSKDKVLEILEKDNSTTKSEPNLNMKSFVKKLCTKKQNDSDLLRGSNNESPQDSLYVIMYSLSQGCDNIDGVLNEMDKLYPNMVEEKLNLQCNLFRSQNAITISDTFMRELLKSLEIYASFHKMDHSNDNVLEHYQFLWLLKLVNRFVISLDWLKIRLSEIENDDQLRSRFCELVSQIVEGVCSTDAIKLKEEQKTGDQTQDSNENLIQSIWNECKIECRNTQNILLNLTAESESDISLKIKEAADNLAQNHITASVLAFIKFIVNSDLLKNMTEDSSAEELFNICCGKVTERIVHSIGKHLLS